MSIINFNQASSRNGKSFYGYGWSAAVAGQYSSVALTCAVSKQLCIEKLYLSGPTSPSNFYLGLQTSALSGYTAADYGANKNSGLGASSSQFFTKQSATSPVSSFTQKLYYLPAALVGPTALQIITLESPIILNPGHSLVCFAEGLNQAMNVGIDFKEFG